MWEAPKRVGLCEIVFGNVQIIQPTIEGGATDAKQLSRPGAISFGLFEGAQETFPVLDGGGFRNGKHRVG